MRRETVCGFLLFLSSFSILAHCQSGEWTWVGGNQAKSNTVATSFGTRGVPSSSNFPGPQSGATTWTDASGNLWLFGGVQSDSSGDTGAGNELWRYSPTTSQWTWIGDGTIDAPPPLLRETTARSAWRLPAIFPQNDVAAAPVGSMPAEISGCSAVSTVRRFLAAT